MYTYLFTIELIVTVSQSKSITSYGFAERNSCTQKKLLIYLHTAVLLFAHARVEVTLSDN